MPRAEIRSRAWALRVALTVFACVSLSATLAPIAAAQDVYSYANGCYSLRDVDSGRFVARDALGYATSAATAAGATPFRLKATALGRYLLYGPDGRMPSAGLLGSVAASSTPGRSRSATI